MKNHFERAMESIDGAPSSGSILIGVASVPEARHLVSIGASGARHLPLHLSLSLSPHLSLLGVRVGAGDHVGLCS